MAAGLQGGTLSAGIYLKPADGAISTDPVKFDLMVSYTRATDGQKFYQTVASYTYGDNLSDWIQLTGSAVIPEVLRSGEIFRFYVQCNNSTMDYQADHSYLVDSSLVSEDDGMLINNYDFEYGSIGWTAPSLTLLSDSTTPSGRIHARVSGRSSTNDGIQQDLDLTLLDGSDYIEIAYWAKMHKSAVNEYTGSLRHHTIRAKINCFTSDGSATQYLAGGQGCDMLNNEWFQYSGTVDISSCRDIASKMTLIISGPEAGIDILVDEVKVTNFSRDRSWRKAADMRTEELRTKPISFNIQDDRVESIELFMIKNGFPFGGVINKHIMNDDYQRESWPSLFNYGVCENEMKWRTNQKNQDQFDYTEADRISDQFNEWGIPLRGHAVVWSVPGKNPDWFEANPSINDLYNRTDEIVGRYAGQITHWDTFNEPLHGNIFVDAFGDEIWNEIHARIKQIDPTALLAINDYELTRADKARCFNDYINGYTSNTEIDLIGLQSHMHPGLNGHYLKNRFDTMAEYGARLWVTELDFDSTNFPFKAEDMEDFMRMAFSHSAVDGIIMWKWLWHERFNWQTEDVTKHSFDSQYGESPADDTWPYHPNESGLKWISLVKNEWNSTQTIQANQANQPANIYLGDYEIIQKDINGDVLYNQTVTISKSESCSTWASSNLLPDGEFNSIDNNWTITGASGSAHSYKILKNGYEGQSVKVSRDEAGQVHFVTQPNDPIDSNTEYEFSFVAKWDKIKEITINGQTILSWSNNYNNYDWEKYKINLNSIQTDNLDLCVKGNLYYSLMGNHFRLRDYWRIFT